MRGKSLEQHVRDDKPEHRIAQKLERLVVDDAARRVLVCARPMRQGMLEQSKVAEVIPDTLFERPHVFAQPPHFSCGGFIEVARNQRFRACGVLFTHAHAKRRLPAKPQRKQSGRQP